MNTNNNIAEAPALTVIPAAALPERKHEITSKSGKVVGQKFWFGKLSAAEIKLELKKADPTLAGNKLTEKVKECLRDEKSQRVMLGHAFVSAMAEKDLVPDEAAMRAKSASLKFVTAASGTDEASKAKAELAQKDAQLDLMARKMNDMMAMLEAAGLQLPEVTAKQG
jgi:hypothetical protein